ncbi:tissue factor pathway inhibitor-like [Acipenser ruthenus]|uniref:tissue factor pathway inhibitor-like n=1 Tax=Acipenser ruthenus TaxID=7906 RepID=UPI002742287E|nr:tissue factor pathway inhibitor-like [Acipenser ruthenus]
MHIVSRPAYLLSWTLLLLSCVVSTLTEWSSLCVLCPLSSSSSSSSPGLPDSPSRPPLQSFRTRPIPVLQLTRSSEEGRELRVVVNTNDPDYEHVYSVENYDDPEEEEQEFYPTVTFTEGETSTMDPVQARRRKRASSDEDPCLLPLDEGTCSRYTLRWYYNPKVAECRPFIYSGCEGNRNRFGTKEDCELECQDTPRDAVAERGGR